MTSDELNCLGGTRRIQRKHVIADDRRMRNGIYRPKFCVTDSLFDSESWMYLLRDCSDCQRPCAWKRRLSTPDAAAAEQPPARRLCTPKSLGFRPMAVNTCLNVSRTSVYEMGLLAGASWNSTFVVLVIDLKMNSSESCWTWAIRNYSSKFVVGHIVDFMLAMEIRFPCLYWSVLDRGRDMSIWVLNMWMSDRLMVEVSSYLRKPA